MARCNQCNKFVGVEEADPEVNSLEIDSDGRVSAEVRIANNCPECSSEMKEASFDVDLEADIEDGHVGVEGHELSVEEGSLERTQRSTGKGRGTRTFYGFELTATITCSCGKLEATDVVLSDDIQASGMDDCQ